MREIQSLCGSWWLALELEVVLIGWMSHSLLLWCVPFFLLLL